MKLDKIINNTPTIMYVGGTGSGKTYKAINESEGKTLIAVPTRQLAYEIMVDYDKFTICNTGEVNLNLERDGKGGSQVCVYESIPKALNTYDRIIIDECHFINDEERGLMLLNNIIKAKNLGIEVVLLTATDSLSDELKELLNIYIVELSPFKEVKKFQIESLEEIKELVKTKSTLIFSKHVPSDNAKWYYSDLLGVEFEDIATISADTPTSERLELQLDFKRGEIKIMISTNVLAQGVNFPAEVVLIEYNEWDEWEIIEQKIGRCGRPQYSDKGYYFLHQRGRKEKKHFPKEKDVEIVKYYRGINISHLKLQDFEIPYDLTSFRGYKYSKKLLNWLNGVGYANREEREALKLIREEEAKLRTLILKERKKNDKERKRRFKKNPKKIGIENPFNSFFNGGEK